VKGLMYNVLEALASRSGCSDEAWELVVEFAAAEALLEQASCLTRPVPQGNTRLSYSSPAEAMIKCLSQDSTEPSFGGVSTLLDRVDNTLGFIENHRPEDLRPTCGFSAEAFLRPEALLEAWGDDWDPTSDEDESSGFVTLHSGSAKKRRA
jgi:hypothetical protein